MNNKSDFIVTVKGHSTIGGFNGYSRRDGENTVYIFWNTSKAKLTQDALKLFKGHTILSIKQKR